MFKPCNRYLLVEKVQQQEEQIQSLIALPEGTFKSENRYEKVKIISVAPSVRPPVAEGKYAVVLNHMIEEVDFGSGVNYLVLENHVLGILEEE